MKRNSLRSMYQGLSGEERFRLAVQAGASGDDSEATYLVNGCPKVVGTVPDPSFTGPALDSFRLASAFAQACGPYLGWLNLVGMLEHLLTGEHGGELLSRGAHLRVAMVLDRAAEAAARDLRALIDAFEDVCSQRTGLPGTVLLKFWHPETAAALEASRDWVQELETDPQDRDRFKARLDHAWTLGD